jgi:hypothetical protein
MALTPSAAVDLIGQLQRVMEAMVKAGMLKPTTPPVAPAKKAAGT